MKLQPEKMGFGFVLKAQYFGLNIFWTSHMFNVVRLNYSDFVSAVFQAIF